MNGRRVRQNKTPICIRGSRLSFIGEESIKLSDKDNFMV
jgi:hypothetical protein